MSTRNAIHALFASALALGLSGCLLPQPDTPIIPPNIFGGPPSAGAPMATSKAPAAVPTSPPMPTQESMGAMVPPTAAMASAGPEVSDKAMNAGTAVPAPMAPAMTPGAMATSMPAAGITADAQAPGHLIGRIEGLVAMRIAAVNVDDAGPGMTQTVLADQNFNLELVPGEYYVELKLANETVRLSQPITVRAGATRNVVITLYDNPPSATVREDVALTKPGPEAKP